MTNGKEKIIRIIDECGGDWRKMNETQLKRIADLTFGSGHDQKPQATYGDVRAIGGTVLRDRVWKAENVRFKPWAKKRLAETGTLDLSFRPGIEMAWESSEEQ
ncbi:hypothetical protein [Planctomycetes bacterium TBK1r]|uniref:Uncharacterized protein n=1 Tax=Stieleria magnilauensis TaxID=2527963 RepID=A0ABX5XY61_9BACT|nr:hypothetical protein TBK1r_59900 [Planctomycetes bacterium TBK1r]QDV87041.1 hypothetical protein TBK1r_60680 [Planctomycetes bacterium TBK1r]